MSKVYYTKISSKNNKEISDKAKKVFLKLIEEEKFKLHKEMPLKVHFGEKGNITYVKSDCMQGVIDELKERKIKSSFIETNVLYRGQRTKRKDHIKLAKEHGFTQLPIIIADGEQGEAYTEVKINQKHIKKAKIASAYLDYEGCVVVSHFKGHIMGGFGGALKQLAMGFAARGGKLDQHANAKPTINPITCKKCGTCQKHCPVDAITLGIIPKIHKDVCIGCADCIANCPIGAVMINWASTMPKKFRQKMIEYSYAAQKDKKHIYLQYAINITNHCDCMDKIMKPIMPNIGVFASTDPVALDAACYDLAEKQGKAFSGKEQLEYAEKIGIGTRKYELVEVKH